MNLPDSILLYGLLVVALAIGFLLGRRDRMRKRRRKRAEPATDDYHGLNMLLSERPELAIDQFVETMAVSEQSLDTHLAMGALLRRRGEIDKSIRIHQNLLAAPVLTRLSKRSVELELARDYHSAGLLDRAENLLSEICAKRGPLRKEAQKLLMEIYEQEREWSKALGVGTDLGHSDQSIRERLGHFECELAVDAMSDGDYKGASTHLQRALGIQPNQARAYGLQAEVEYAGKHYKRVQKALQRAVEIAPDLAEEYVELFQAASDHLGDGESYERFLRACIERRPHSSILRKLIQYLQGNGAELNADQVWQNASWQPDLHHLKILLETELGGSEHGQRINAYVQKIISSDKKYRCTNCGFRSGQLMWHCPTCRVWGSFATTEGVQDP